MTDERWNQLVDDVEGQDIEAMVEASQCLYQEADESDVPRLLQLLSHDDFVVREAAAWPLAGVGGPAVLPELFVAYQRGFDDGYDNDGFTTALIELVALHKPEATKKLRELAESPDGVIRGHANWLLDFC